MLVYNIHVPNYLNLANNKRIIYFVILIVQL